MRILQVISDTDRRGAQVFATDLGAALADRGHEVRTVALLPGRVGGLEVEHLAASRTGPALYRALRQHMRAADITVAHGGSTLVSCALAGFPNLPFVYRQISEVRFWAGTWQRRARVATYLRRARMVVALSNYDARSLQEHYRFPASKIRIIPNGVPAARVLPGGHRPEPDRHGVPDGAPLVVYVGALVPEKGVGVLIDAMRLLPQAHLLVVGDGLERPSLKRQAAVVAAGRVHFSGTLPSAASAIAAADVLVLPSLSEAAPAVLIEAGFLGVPVVATTVGALPELVSDGKTGLLVEPGQPGPLADAIGRLLGNYDLADRLADAARERCTTSFEIGVVADRWAAVLAKIARPTGRRTASPMAAIGCER